VGPETGFGSSATVLYRYLMQSGDRPIIGNICCERSPIPVTD